MNSTALPFASALTPATLGILTDSPAEARQKTIDYGYSDDAWTGIDSFLRDLVVQRGCKVVCDIGGGANPALPLDFLNAHKVECLVYDISASELAKAPAGYTKVTGDITRDVPAAQVGRCDLVFSKMLAEHVRDAEAFHKNIHRLLRPGGLSFHFFPTLFTLPFVANRLLPERLAYAILNLLQSGREKHGKLAKFPAYYKWCRGPLQSQFRRFEGCGFRVLKYVGFFGHPPYYSKLPLVRDIHRLNCRWLVKHPIPAITSFAWVILEKV
jgi:SAM-dependent methyltransferase